MKSNEDIVRPLYTHAADLLKNGVSEKDLKRDLEEHGLDSESAKAVIRNLAAVKIEQRKKQGKKYMSYGALWCIVGTVVTLLTYTKRWWHLSSHMGCGFIWGYSISNWTFPVCDGKHKKAFHLTEKVSLSFNELCFGGIKMWLNEKLLRVAVTSIMLVSASMVSATNLYGTVSFQEKPLFNATVQLWLKDKTKPEHTGITDKRGYYMIRQVPLYCMKCEFSQIRNKC